MKDDGCEPSDAAEAMRLPPDAATVIDEIVIQAPRFLPEFEHSA